MKNLLISSVLGVMFLGGSAFAAPKQNVSPRKHPHLAAAQAALKNAYLQTSAAQKANEWDLNGHAEKAKALMEQADAELKQAAETSNERH